MKTSSTLRSEPARRRALLALACACAALLLPAESRAQEIAAVLSKGSGPYFETFLAFQRTMGRPVAAYDISEQDVSLPRKMKVAAAFGAKAAAYKYPAGTALVYALAPGYDSETPGAVKISMLPEPARALEAYKALQPELKRLAVFLGKPGSEYLDELIRAGKPLGVEIIPVTLKGPGEFPETLRALAGKMDAFWLFPQPSLITRTSLNVLAEFSCSNQLPFYTPSAGLTELGAAASFAPSFEELGRAAAGAVKARLAGERLPASLYAARAEMTVNYALIKKCGLPLAAQGPSEARK